MWLGRDGSPPEASYRPLPELTTGFTRASVHAPQGVHGAPGCLALACSCSGSRSRLPRLTVPPSLLYAHPMGLFDTYGPPAPGHGMPLLTGTVPEEA